MNTIRECTKCQGKGITYYGFTGSQCHECKGTGKLFEISFNKGTTSHSMGVNTKPAHRLDFNGHWILIDPTIPESKLEHIKELINQIKP